MGGTHGERRRPENGGGEGEAMQHGERRRSENWGGEGWRTAEHEGGKGKRTKRDILSRMLRHAAEAVIPLDGIVSLVVPCVPR